jgi:hypothetical protein
MVYPDFTQAVTSCTMPALCTASSTETTVGADTYTVAITCDGTAAAPSTGCMVILVFLVLYV